MSRLKRRFSSGSAAEDGAVTARIARSAMDRIAHVDWASKVPGLGLTIISDLPGLVIPTERPEIEVLLPEAPGRG
jgi:hypothetical protein